MLLQPYLFFNGRCEEAIAFYGRALGAKVELLMRNSDSPEPPPPGMLPPGSEQKIMHVTMKIGDQVLMASDGHCSGTLNFSGFALSLTMPDKAAADRAFAALAAGGQVQMPLSKTFWSPYFGMVSDHFGVQWMIAIPD